MVSTLLTTVITFGLVAQALIVPQRPDIKAHPIPPNKPFPISPPRTKSCFVKPSCKNGTDDAPKILKAFQDCNNGGTVVLNANYTICSPLDLRFLQHVDVALTGTVNFCDDVEKWQPLFFPVPYQNNTAWWLWGGEDINLYGLGQGTIHGHGQAFYDAWYADRNIYRPLLFVTDGWHGGSITGLKLRHSPMWHNLIANSSDILISDIDMFSRSTSENDAKNLDGWDTYRSDNLVIQNSYLDHDDDCVSFKPNSSNIIVQGLDCNSSHGISVGSLGQYLGVTDIVEHIYVYNNTLHNSAQTARIKVWPGHEAAEKPSWNSGGGIGRVSNITYEIFRVDGNDNAIIIDACYGSANSTACQAHPSKMMIEDVVFKDFYGVTNRYEDPIVGQLICSSEESCSNIQASNITVYAPSGKPPQWRTRHIDRSLLDVYGEFVEG